MSQEILKKAQDIIQSVKGKVLSLEERTEKTIELTACMLKEARRIETPWERRHQAELARMMEDSLGKVFTTSITDQCFRSQRAKRVADQLVYMIDRYGIPKYLSLSKRISFYLFKLFGKPLAFLMVPLVIHMLRKETSHVILPGEAKALKKHLRKRKMDRVKVNLNHLGEAILGEEEAQHRLQIYVEDLQKPEIEYISVKISTIFSQINLLSWEDTVVALTQRLSILYRAAMQNKFRNLKGVETQKFVNLDMEEYRDLHLTVEVFKTVLNKPEFSLCSAGIVLQSYLPDSYSIQQDLTKWALERVSEGKSPIKIRLVKGANLAMEQVEASLKEWPQAPYKEKFEVDANFKKMIDFGCQPDHAKAVYIGVGSHNLFDIAYAMLLRSERGVENSVSFEMLEGMADPMRRVVQALSGGILLYCPAANRAEFQNAVAYLIRRLDENTAPENFLRHSFDLVPGNEVWQKQADLFRESALASKDISSKTRRLQDRNSELLETEKTHSFTNEPDTDWSLLQNRKWAKNILFIQKSIKYPIIPLVIDGKQIKGLEPNLKDGFDPSCPQRPFYTYTLASQKEVESALTCSKEAGQRWASVSVEKRADLLKRIAHKLRQKRGHLIGAMIANTGKTFSEADTEVSEAIDFAEYYSRNILEWSSMPDIQWKAKGTVLVASPWNFPCSIPAGGILAALAAGNAVIFKPAPESVLVGWELVNLFWAAGVDQETLQFLTCEEEPVGSQLIQDQRLDAVILTGSTSTAKLFLALKPGLDLMAETGGKNIMVITSMADRDLAIKDLTHSAFGYAGQKCSACSLAILEAELYDDPHFLNQLKDAVASLSVGSAWNPKTRLNPLIRSPNDTLLKGLTILEEGEEWLLEPKQSSENPYLWTPGIKLGVKTESFTFQNELFGPVLGLVRADDFNQALELMNLTPYGLTAGIHSLDEREQQRWLNKVEAGNCYINRTMTGAIVQRQPFGGCKDSSFGKGAKAGGPNYLTQLMHAKQWLFPKEREQENSRLSKIKRTLFEEKVLFDFSIWDASIGSYSYYWKYYFSKKQDPSLVLGQDNFQCYVPHSIITFRIQKWDLVEDYMRVVGAALICKTILEISVEDNAAAHLLSYLSLPSSWVVLHETEKEFKDRIVQGNIKRARLLKAPSLDLKKAFSNHACNLHIAPVLANGRLELLHYLREVNISHDYHRYGNLGERENESRLFASRGCNCHG